MFVSKILGTMRLSGACLVGGYVLYKNNHAKTSFADNVLLTKRPVPYLIIGGGAAGYSTAINIINNDPEARVLIVGKEGYTPYMKPLLSKDLWESLANNHVSIESVENGSNEAVFVGEIPEVESPFDDEKKFQIIKGRAAVHLNTDTRTVTLDNGDEVRFKKLIIATGARMVYQGFVTSELLETNKNNFMHFSSVDDMIRLYKCLRKGNQTVVITDSNFLGCELLKSLSEFCKALNLNNRIVMVSESKPFSSILPEFLSDRIISTYSDYENVSFHLNKTVSECAVSEKSKLKVKLILNNDEVINNINLIIDCKLTKANTPFVRGESSCSGAACPTLTTDAQLTGYATNGMLQTGGHDIFAVGDCATYYDPVLDCVRRNETFSHAVSISSTVAGNAIFDKDVSTYRNQPWWSIDLPNNLRIEGAGMTSSKENEMFVVEVEATDEFAACPEQPRIVFYTKDRVVVGVVTWNLFDKSYLIEHIINGRMQYPEENVDEFFVELAKHFMKKEVDDDLDDQEINILPDEIVVDGEINIQPDEIIVEEN